MQSMVWIRYTTPLPYRTNHVHPCRGPAQKNFSCTNSIAISASQCTTYDPSKILLQSSIAADTHFWDGDVNRTFAVLNAPMKHNYRIVVEHLQLGSKEEFVPVWIDEHMPSMNGTTEVEIGEEVCYNVYREGYLEIQKKKHQKGNNG